jgi:type II restriction/modification system DNA methylase subunit YeeA
VLVFNKADRQIDKLVYELYGLTEDEIKIVEGT